MNIALAPTPRTPAAHSANQAVPNCPPSVCSGQLAATNLPRASTEPELAVVAVLGYN